jgi:uncharacterized protein (TIGR03437 family)
MKFRSAVAGYVTGVRFFKASGSIGTHTGKLWSKGGALLTSVNFSNETASGWQQASFPAPVAITAGTTYIISYTNQAGAYSSSSQYFKTSGVTNGPLKALKDGEDGSNGVYGYSTTTLPTASYKARNYWVDVVFNTAVSAPQSYEPGSLTPELTSSSTTQPSTLPGTSGEAVPAKESPVARSLHCAPKLVQAGGTFTCELQLGGQGGAFHAPVAASSSDVRVPPTVRARQHQQFLTFHGSVDAAAPPSTVVVTVGDEYNLVGDEITVQSSPLPVISLPEAQLVKAGQLISFEVAASDPGDLPVRILVSDLPPGASFEEDSGRFEWLPGPGQQGEFTVAFHALNSDGQSSDAKFRIVVGSGNPEVTAAARTACSPGAVVTLDGKWLGIAGEGSVDPSGASLELDGTRVHLNGELVPVLLSNQTRVDFLCPAGETQPDLRVTLDTPFGATVPVQMARVAARPEFLRVPDHNAGQALVTIAGTNRIAAIRDYRGIGEPAQAGDVVSFSATGLGIVDSYAGSIFVKVGEVDAPVQSVHASPDAAGVFLVQVRIPIAAPLGDKVPVRLEIVSADGQRRSSNTATLAIE